MNAGLIRRVLLGVSVVGLGLAGHDALARSGRPAAAGLRLRDCCLYVPAGTPPSVKMAADELQLHLAMVIGRKLEIVSNAVPPMIALGDSPDARAAGIVAAELPYEGFRILNAGSNLFIVGRDLPDDGPTPTDGKSLGTLYGAYEFLQAVVGIRWLLPGELGTYAPPPNPDLVVGGLDLRFAPKFKYRRYFIQGGTARDSLAYARRNRTLDFQWTLDPDHAWYMLYPEAGSPDAAVIEDRTQTFRKHPGYFEMALNGKRVEPAGMHFSLCLSNPDIPRDVAQRVVRLHGSRPSCHTWRIMPNDGGPTCYCPECAKRVYVPTPEEKGICGRGTADEKSWTPLVLDYYRKTAGIVRDLAPGLYVNGGVYQKYEFPPRVKPEPLPDNFIAVMAPQHTAYGPLRLYPPINRNWERWIDSWDGVFRLQTYYGLEFWLRQWAGAPLSPYPDVMKSTFHRLSERGFMGAYFYSMPMGANAPYNWVILQMLWKPDGDPQELLEEFCRKAYGAGGDGVLKIYRLSDAGMRQFITARQGNVGHNMSPEMMQDIYAAHWAEYEDAFREAAAGVSTPGERWRLSVLENNLKTLRYHLTALGMLDDDARAPFRLSSADYQRLVDLGYPGGPWRGLVDTPPEALPLTRAWRPLRVTAADGLPRAEPRTGTFLGTGMDIVCLAETDGEAALQLEYRVSVDPATGREFLPEIGYYHVFDGTGKKLVTAIARRGRIVFPARRGETYSVAYMPLATKGSGSSWRVSGSTGVRYALGSRLDRRGLYVTDHGKPATPFYFHVPEQTSTFTLFINFSTAGAELMAPDGTMAARGAGYAALKIDRAASHLPAGWWKVRMLDNGSGFIRQGPELDGFFVDDPDRALRVEIVRAPAPQ